MSKLPSSTPQEFRAARSPGSAPAGPRRGASKANSSGFLQPPATSRTVLQPRGNEKYAGTKPTRRPRRLQPRQLAALRALVGGCTVTEAARRVGAARQTIWRWLAREDFTTELRRLNRQLMAEPAADHPPAEPAPERYHARRPRTRAAGRPTGATPADEAFEAEFSQWLDGLTARLPPTAASVLRSCRPEPGRPAQPRSRPDSPG